jgi:hypothetical protein
METIPKKRNVLFLSVVALILGFVFTVLFFNEGLGINVLLMVGLVISGGLCIADIYGKKLDPTSAYLIAPVIFFAGMVFVRASALLTFFNVLGCILLLLIILRSYSGKTLLEYLPLDYFKTFLVPFLFLAPMFETIGDTFSTVFNLRTVSSNPRTREIVRGVLMSVVAVVVFAALFAAADATFQRFISGIFSFDLGLNEETLGRLAVFIFASAVFIGAFAYAFRKDHSAPHYVADQKPRTMGILETKILLGSINVLFLIFIILQLAHLFGGGGQVVSQGLTYAEYARKGFFELILVAILSYLIISTAEKQIVKNEHSHTQSFKILSTILVAQVVVILVSAFMRLALYESTYGFTTIRLYSHALMVWLAAVLILLAHHIHFGGSRTKFALRVFIAIIVLLFTMNLLNPDVFIAKRNLERYQATGRIDTWYLGSLSMDAIPYTSVLLNNPDPVIVKSFSQSIIWKMDSDSEQYSWPSFHVARSRGEAILAPNKKFIEFHGSYKNEVRFEGNADTEILDL